MCKYELPMSRLSKFIVCQTHRQTNTIEIIYHATSREVKKRTTYAVSNCTTDKRCYCNRNKSADTNDTHVNEEVLKQVPHARTCVDFFDFDLSVDVAVTQEVHIHRLHLMYKSCERSINEHFEKHDQHLIICCLKPLNEKPLTNTCMPSRPTQLFILLGSINEDQLRVKRKKLV